MTTPAPSSPAGPGSCEPRIGPFAATMARLVSRLRHWVTPEVCIAERVALDLGEAADVLTWMVSALEGGSPDASTAGAEARGFAAGVLAASRAFKDAIEQSRARAAHEAGQLRADGRGEEAERLIAAEAHVRELGLAVNDIRRLLLGAGADEAWRARHAGVSAPVFAGAGGSGPGADAPGLVSGSVTAPVRGPGPELGRSGRRACPHRADADASACDHCALFG